jgi:raffinose/stachyose/melibiose transport system substrate-binding protein
MNVNIKVLIGLFILLFTVSAYFLGGLKWDGSVFFRQRDRQVPVRIRYAFNWTAAEPAGKILMFELKRFSAQTGIEIIPEVVPWDELLAKIKVDAAVNDLPDIFNCFGGDASLYYLVQKEYLLEIDEYLELSHSTKAADFAKDAFNYFKMGGKRYGVPIMKIRTFWGCNRSLFQKYRLQYPQTYADLKKAARVFRAHGIIPLAVGSRGGVPANLFFSELYAQLPGGSAEIRALPVSYQVDTANMRKICALIAEMRRNRFFPADTYASGDWVTSLSLYNQEKAAMIYSCNYIYSRLTSKILKNTVLVPAPRLPGGLLNTAKAVIDAPAFGFVINKNAFANPEKARALTQLADLLTSDRMIKAWAKTGILPVKNTVSPEALALPPFLKRLTVGKRNIQKLPAHFFDCPDPDTLSMYLNSLDEFWAGAINTDQFIFKVQQSFNEFKLRR